MTRKNKGLAFRTNITLWLYEQTLGRIDLTSIRNKFLAFFLGILLLPLYIMFFVVSILVEEPLICIGSVLLMYYTPKDAWNHYKKCWKVLIEGIKT